MSKPPPHSTLTYTIKTDDERGALLARYVKAIQQSTKSLEPLYPDFFALALLTVATPICRLQLKMTEEQVLEVVKTVLREVDTESGENPAKK